MVARSEGAIGRAKLSATVSPDFVRQMFAGNRHALQHAGLTSYLSTNSHYTAKKEKSRHEVA